MKNIDEMDEITSKECAASRIKHLDDELLVAESGKMVFLVQLLDNLRSEGHRALVFSQSRRMLDIIQKVMTARVLGYIFYLTSPNYYKQFLFSSIL